jgi:hypothetical protein
MLVDCTKYLEALELQQDQSWGRMGCKRQEESKASHGTDSIEAPTDRQGSAD